MSEYQYYEFQAIDRPLTKAEKDAISELSSRVKPTTTRATFTYSYGDFRGDPLQVLAQYFDVMYYIANWGTQQLAFRFPKSLISKEIIEPYCIENCISLSFNEDWAILNWEFSQEEGFEHWIEGEGILSELAGLRQEILQQDYRGLYLAWLKAITVSEDYVEIDETQLEPPVPAGLSQLSSAQKAFSEIFELDEHLITVASRASSQTDSITDEDLKGAIAQLSRSESDGFLLRLAQGESNLSAKLKRKLSEFTSSFSNPSQSQRTIQQLQTAASQEYSQTLERQRPAAEDQRIRELEELAPKKAQIWAEVEELLQKAHVKNYEQAVEWLVKLQDLAAYQNQLPAFREKLSQIRQQYSKRSLLIERLSKAGL